MDLTITNARPRWPVESLDAARFDVHYDLTADELTLYFGGRPVPAYSSFIDAPDGTDVAVFVGLGPDGRSTEEVVGIHVYPLLVGAVQWRPEWARLAWGALAREEGEEGDEGEEMLHEALPGFVADVADLFARYWKPAPPIDEPAVPVAAGAGVVAGGATAT